MNRVLLIFSISLLSLPLFGQDIKIYSSSQKLVEVFEWAKVKARSYVMTGKKGPINISERNADSSEVSYIPSYWAGYPLRTAFYSRDFCHQAVGAHLLGLEEENFSMLKAFAASATKERKWYPLWAINFDGSPYLLDYRHDSLFVREVPAVFELVEKAYQLYSWTGDKKYINDEILWNYYSKTVSDFITLHDTKFPNQIAEGTGEGNIFKGVATYNEQRDVHLIEAGDGIASQYQALLSFSKLLTIKGRKGEGKAYEKKAAELKHYFNTDWGIKNTELLNRGYTIEKIPIDGWGKENSWFILMKGIADTKSDRYIKYLNFIYENLKSKDNIPENIEALSYIPEVFFQYHQDELGWEWMEYIIDSIDKNHAATSLTGSNGNYPEISYVLIANTISNLAGFTPMINNNKVYSISHLPKEIDFLKVENIPIGDCKIDIEHKGKEMSTFSYKVGKKNLEWNAGFVGHHKYLYINNKKVKCLHGDDYGTIYSYYPINLKPGEKVTVSVNP